MKYADAVVIVGSGAAGHSCARTLRQSGFTGGVLVVDAEGAGINRTLVDTGLLPGLLTAEQIALPTLPEVEAVRGRVVGLEGDGRTVVLDDGRRLRGERLVIASGRTPRALDRGIAVEAGAPLHPLHGIADAERLRRAVPDPSAARVVVLGAGFIGAEVASFYADAGAVVTLIGRSSRPLERALGSGIAERLARRHAERTDFRWGRGVRAIRSASGGARGARVELETAEAVGADAVIVAVGSVPAAAWAGFPGGIPTDDRLRVAGWDGVYAAGGAAAPRTAAGILRVDHWDAAAAQGAHAARALLHDLGAGEDPGPYLPVSGFTLMAHGAAIAARGVRAEGAAEEEVALDGGGLLTRFIGADGRVTGVAGWNAGARVAAEAARIVADPDLAATA
ncbi:FAD-dependent oxidoreductase [Leucobacter tenebrionis]|uniref:FAD-dependent oxidoreductase n=1 Tax=Leucobacter tenebrionis TaxID=2873270 RepID=UPI001CA6709F|nr:NAD(P)/FAD-dependent oxidoreductase [Leucobacter tenebrionis]QZY50731.1 NAD(P)/FAD-dependent oxidoreductase [Leucobacter tenebrionis]